VDLGKYALADEACAAARELDASNLWGPLATSFIARAQGDTAGALQWIDAGLKLAPNDLTLVASKVELLNSLGRTADARAAIDALRDDGSFVVTARKGGVVFAESGADGLKAWLAQQNLPKRAGTSDELVELAWLQFIAGESASARATLEHAERILPLSTADLYDGSQIRHAYSAALLHAGIELRGGGDRAKALAMLGTLDAMLAKYRKHGGTHYGAWTLQAESLALQGKTAGAEAALKTAYEHGWRTTWRADREPYLQGVDLGWLAAKQN
jgi:tetratricopeptide (TPR) repeat protein